MNIVHIPVTLAIIAGVAMFTLNNAKDVMSEARDVRRSLDAYQTTLALGIYYDDHLAYPLYTDSDSQKSWHVLKKSLATDYIQELPNDPDSDNKNTYRYWSNGRTAKIFYWSEVEQKYKERWTY